MLARVNRHRPKVPVVLAIPAIQAMPLTVAAKNMVANLATTLRMWRSTTGDITNIT